MSKDWKRNQQQPTVVRWGVLALLALASASAYLTRHCIAVANTTIQEEHNFTTEQMGTILSVFMLGYFIFQIPSAWLASRWGPRAVLSSLSLLWSLVTLGTAAVTSFVPMLLSRAIFGVAQAGLVPTTALAIRDWFPAERRGFSSAVIDTSMSVGAIVTMGLTAWLMEFCPWRVVFGLYSLVGIAWACAFFLYFRNRPAEHPRVNQAERDLIRSGSSTPVDKHASGDSEYGADAPQGAAPADSQGVQIREPSIAAMMVKSRNIWAISMQQFFRAFAYAVLVTWLPAYLTKRYDVPREEAGYLAMLPLIMIVIGVLPAGIAVDALLSRTGNKFLSRSLVAFAGMSLGGLFTLASVWTSSPTQHVVLLSVGGMFAAVAAAPSWAATMDVAGRHSAVAIAVMNTVGAFGAYLSPELFGRVIGYIERTQGDWNLFVYVLAGNYVVGAIFWLAVRPNETLTKRVD